MLPTNEKGEIITIENVFHSLTTRLIKLKNGIKDARDLEFDFEDVIAEIENQIYGHEPASALPFITISQTYISQIRQLGKDILKRLEHRWGFTKEEEQYYQTISNEMDFYVNELNVMEKELIEIKSNSTEPYTGNNFDKIPINISVPRLSWLVHFMVGDNDEFDKLFNAEKKAFCRGLISMLKHPTGDNISLDSLCDKWTDVYSMQASLKFWIERFSLYETKCENVLKEKGFL